MVGITTPFFTLRRMSDELMELGECVPLITSIRLMREATASNQLKVRSGKLRRRQALICSW
ncbi:hypothetical protein D3C80_911760 [compost metagenome]